MASGATASTFLAFLAFLFFFTSGDLASAVLFCLNKNITENNLNVGSSDYFSIKELAKLIKKITNYKGDVFFNKRYPDGVKFRKLDLSKIHKLGWRSKIRLEDGLKQYYKYFKELNLNENEKRHL